MENKMKTDLERFVELYKSFGIECVVNGDEYGMKFISLHGSLFNVATESSRLIGYSGLFSEVVFYSDGSFNKQGFWK